MAEWWQPLLSLGAVGALVALVHALRLGSRRGLSHEAVRDALDGLIDDPILAEVALDQSAGGALAAGRQGQVILLKTHGAHCAARMLDGRASAQVDGAFLVVDPADRRFGVVRLRLPEADRWKRLIDRL